MRITLRKVLLISLQIVTTGLIIFGLWRFTETSTSFIVVPFKDIWQSFKDTFLFSEFSHELVPTLRRIGTAFVLAILVGVPAGMILGSSAFLRALMGPQLSFVRAVPPIALVPPAIILIGLGDKMMIILTVFVAMWPIVLNVADGVREIDQTMIDTSQVLRMSRRQKLRYLTLPAVAPRMFTGLHTALVFCIIGIVAVEYLTGSEGIGFLLQESQQTINMAAMWSVIIMLGLLGNLFNILFNLVQRRALYWTSDVENF